MLCIELELIQKTVMKLKRKSNTLAQITIGLSVFKKVLPLLVTLFVVFKSYSQTVTIENVSGDEDDGVITLTATYNTPFTTGSFTLDVYTIDDAATEGDNDYTPILNQQLSFFGNDGETIDFQVLPVSDTDVELDENLLVRMRNFTPAGLFFVDTSDEAEITINNDDTGTVSVTTITNSDEEGPVNGQFRVNISERNATGGNLTVAYTLSGSATQGVGEDFTITGAATFSELQLNRNINVITIDDDLIEGAEDVVLTLDSTNIPDFIIGATDEATISISDNDAGIVSVTATDDNANEQGANIGRFRIEISDNNNTGTTLTVNYTLSGSANENNPNQDYTVSGVATFNPSQLARNITITPIDDTLLEGAEDVVLTLDSTNLPEFTIGTPNEATVTIADNDAAEVTIGNATIEEGGTLQFDITLDNEVPGGFDVNTSYTDVSATGGGLPLADPEDYNNASQTINFSGNAGETQQLSIATFNDNVLEGIETFTVNIDADNVNVTDSDSGTGTITDNDTAEVSISDVTVTEDVASGTLDFTVTLNNAVAGGVEVSYTFTDGTAAGGGEDYTGIPGSVIFDGTFNEEETISVPITDDALLESSEDFTIQLSTPSVTGVTLRDTGSATGTITDDDNCISEVPSIDLSMPTMFCGDTTVNLNDFVTNNPPSGTSLVWSQSSNPLNLGAHIPGAQVDINVGSSGAYYTFFYDSGRSCASSTVEVVLSANEMPSILSTSGAERCGPGDVVLTATASPGASLNWYASIDATVDIEPGGTSFERNVAATTSFFVEAEFNGCFSSRVEVIATVVPQVFAGSPSDGSVCSVEGNGPVSVDLDERLSGIVSNGFWAITSDPSGGGVSIDFNNEVDFTGLIDGDYQFTYTTTGAQAPCVNESVVVTIVVTDCETDEDGDGLLGGEEAILGTNPNEADTDGDGINDGDEVGGDIQNPLNEDNDEFIDALDSNVNDEDGDGIFDQQDIANSDACVPNLTIDCNPNPVDLGILKTVENADAAIGENVVFTITINNLSNSPILSAEVSEILESGFEYVSHLASDGEYNEPAGMWNLGPMDALGQATLEITATVLEGGVYTNTAELFDSFPIDNTAENNSATVDLNVDIPEGVDLLIEKSAVSQNPLVGDEVIFTIKVTNLSIEDMVSQIMVRDLIGVGDNNGFQYQSHTIIEGNDDSYDENTGIWIIPQLEKDEFATIEITAVVLSDGVFSNTAEILSSSPVDSNPDNNSASVEVTVHLPNEADPGFVFNQFSPNTDGTNDFLKIRDIGTFPNASIQIFDRYGNIVFEAVNMQEDEVWDGTRESDESPAGTYFYVLDLGDGTSIRKGWIQLLR